VEDHVAVAKLIRVVLEREHIEVTIADTGERGLELAQEKRFDAILLDVDLPGISGFEVCRHLAQNNDRKGIAVIFVTSRTSDEDQQTGFELGAVDYIGKPFDATRFAARVMSHVERARKANSPAQGNGTGIRD
jgi:putative two-component system response regulator